ncbi:MAG: putative cytokinetic ring protein SteA [Bacillus sp. (in: Bacteria)]|nr:putative cytokinetic ring protein SteA [Bacillus sp. (in: firmicutes)]
MYLKGKGQWFLASKVAKYSYNEVLEKLQLGVDNYHCLFKRFAENSFQYGLKEIEEFLKSVKNLPKLSEITNKQVFVIARGYQLEEELIAAKDILQKPNCVTIAVDGAATLLENHLIHPKFIIGDMDSLSDDCHYEHSTFIAHSYLNGRSPGQERLKKKAIRSIAVPFPGLSEDLAIMIAYVSNADHIFTIGCRTSVPELVEKGRSGMASTLLTRMFMGEKVSDWKAIHKLFSHKPTFNNIFWSQFYQEEYKADEG